LIRAVRKRKGSSPFGWVVQHTRMGAKVQNTKKKREKGKDRITVPGGPGLISGYKEDRKKRSVIIMKEKGGKENIKTRTAKGKLREKKNSGGRREKFGGIEGKKKKFTGNRK